MPSLFMQTKVVLINFYSTSLLFVNMFLLLNYVLVKQILNILSYRHKIKITAVKGG